MRRCSQYTGLAGVATLWTTLAAATVGTGFDLFGEHPISYLGTSAGGAAALFTVGLLVSALLLIAFHQFVRSRWPVGIGFSVATFVGLAGQVVAAFVPIGGDTGVHRIHTTSALILGISLPLLIWRFAAAQPPGAWRRLCYRLFFLEVLACAVGLYLSGHSIAPVAEILPAAVFHVWVLVLSFSAAASGEEPAYRHLPRPGRSGEPALVRRGAFACVFRKSPEATGSSGPGSPSPAGLNPTGPG